MDPDLMTDEQLAERDLVLVTCTGCGETYGYKLDYVEELRAELDSVLAYIVADSDWIGDKWWKNEKNPKHVMISDAANKRRLIEPLVQDYRKRMAQ